jgi:hypothetical protein
VSSRGFAAKAMTGADPARFLHRHPTDDADRTVGLFTLQRTDHEVPCHLIGIICPLAVPSYFDPKDLTIDLDTSRLEMNDHPKCLLLARDLTPGQCRRLVQTAPELSRWLTAVAREASRMPEGPG